MLRPDHLAELEIAASLLAWSRLPLKFSDAEYLRKAEAIMPRLHNPTLRKLVRDRLIQRTVVAALRRREAGQDAPPPNEIWGYGEMAEHIRKNWRDPSFGLGPSYKWIATLKDQLAAGDAAAAERTLLERVWRQALRLAGMHDFDFEAVALYVMRWHLLDRWTRYDAELAAARFGDLIAEALDAAPQLHQLDHDEKEAAA